MPDTPLICHECWAKKPNHYEPCPHTMGLVNHFHEQLKQKELQIGTLTKERDEARRLAKEEFAQILKDQAEGERYNALGREENAKLKTQIANISKGRDQALTQCREMADKLEQSNRLLSEAKEQERAMQAALEEWAEMYGERTTILLVLHTALERIRNWQFRIQEPGGEMDINTIADEALAEFQKETSGEKRAALKRNHENGRPRIGGNGTLCDKQYSADESAYGYCGKDLNHEGSCGRGNWKGECSACGGDQYPQPCKKCGKE